MAEFVGNINTDFSTKQIRVYFAGTLVFDSTAFGLSISSWGARIFIIRSGSSSARVNIDPSRSIDIPVTEIDVTGITYSATNILKVTGTAGSSGEITAKMGTIFFYGAA